MSNPWPSCSPPSRCRLLGVPCRQAGASVVFEIGVVDHVRIAFGPTLAVRPVALSYRVGDTDAVVFQPWTVRPGFTIELRWDSH
jgi:hypothetical protein